MRFITILLLSLFINDLKSQSNQNFVMDLPLNLSNFFGELRQCFHSGIDIKINRVEGLNDFSNEKFTLVEFRFQPTDMASNIYNLTDGKITVYAHPKQIFRKNSNYVKDIQYKKAKVCN